MSLLLDALKKAAEKNASKSVESNPNQDPPQQIVTDESLENDDIDDTNSDILTLSYDFDEQDAGNLKQQGTEFNLDADTNVDVSEPEEKQQEEDESLTHEDVTAFMGSREPYAEYQHKKDEKTITQKRKAGGEIELALVDSTATNLKPLMAEAEADPEDEDDGSELVFLATEETDTSLKHIANYHDYVAKEKTVLTAQADTYDKASVQLHAHDISTFTQQKESPQKGTLLPETAKKVFASKTSVFQNSNYRLYLIIALVLICVISAFTFFQMQTQIVQIDNGLMQYKMSPIKKIKSSNKVDNNSSIILEGGVDLDALRLLKSLEDESKQPLNHQQKALKEDKQDDVKESIDKAALNEQKKAIEDKTSAPPQKVSKETQSKQPTVKTVEVSSQKNTPQKKQETKIEKTNKAAIKIESTTQESKETALLKSAYSAYEKGDLDQAKQKYQAALNINKNNRDALLGQAAIFSAQQNNPQAIQNYQRILLNNPKDALAITSLIAVSAISPTESESQLKRLQKTSPKTAYLNFALGNVIGAQNRWQEAQHYYFEAFQAEPNNADYAYNLAVSLEQISQQDLAITYYKKALQNAVLNTATFDEALIKERLEVLTQ